MTIQQSYDAVACQELHGLTIGGNGRDTQVISSQEQNSRKINIVF